MDGGAFAAGQTYVALSRCVSLENLYLTTPVRREDIIINQEAAEFMGKNEDFDSSEPKVFDANANKDVIDKNTEEDDFGLSPIPF